jgi:hypothetical protein
MEHSISALPNVRKRRNALLTEILRDASTDPLSVLSSSASTAKTPKQIVTNRIPRHAIPYAPDTLVQAVADNIQPLFHASPLHSLSATLKSCVFNYEPKPAYSKYVRLYTDNVARNLTTFHSVAAEIGVTTDKLNKMTSSLSSAAILLSQGSHA